MKRLWYILSFMLLILSDQYTKWWGIFPLTNTYVNRVQDIKLVEVLLLYKMTWVQNKKLDCYPGTTVLLLYKMTWVQNHAFLHSFFSLVLLLYRITWAQNDCVKRMLQQHVLLLYKITWVQNLVLFRMAEKE